MISTHSGGKVTGGAMVRVNIDAASAWHRTFGRSLSPQREAVSR